MDTKSIEFFLEAAHATELTVAREEASHVSSFGLISMTSWRSRYRAARAAPGRPSECPCAWRRQSLSRMRLITSRSNCANDSKTFRVRRPIEVVVLNCWVTATNETARASKSSTILSEICQQSAYADRPYKRLPHQPAPLSISAMSRCSARRSMVAPERPPSHRNEF